MKFLLQNQEKFTSNIEVHNINTRNKLKLHKPISNVTLYQRGVYYMSIRIFNVLPDCIAKLVENKVIYINFKTVSSKQTFLLSRRIFKWLILS